MWAARHSDELTAQIDDAMDAALDDVGDAFGENGDEVKAAIRRINESWTAAEEDAARIYEEVGVFPTVEGGPSFARAVLARTHAYRAFEAWHNPNEFIHVAEMFDPQMAAELNARYAEQQLRASGIGAGGGPHINRRRLGDLGAEAPVQTPDAGKSFYSPIRPEHMAQRLGLMEAGPRMLIGHELTARTAANKRELDHITRAFAIRKGDIAKRVGVDSTKELQMFTMRYPGEDPSAWQVRLYEKYGERAGRMIDEYDRLHWNSMIMPDSPYYSVLAETRLPLEVVGTLEGRLGTGVSRWGFTRGYKNLVSKWKFGKAVLNTSAHIRNMMSNMILTYNKVGIGGLNPGNIRRAIVDLADDGPMTQLLQKHSTLLSDTSAHHDIGAMSRSFDIATEAAPKLGAVSDAWKFVTGGLGRAYEYEEKLGKVVVFSHVYPKQLKRFAGEAYGEALEKMAAESAAQIAEETLFNYRKVPPVVNWLRGYGLIPFATFPYKALPATFKAAVENPARVAAVPKILQTLADLDEQRDEMDAGLPEWMQTGTWQRFPTGGGGEQTAHYFDLSYLLPWGDMLDHGAMFLQRRNPEAWGGAIPINIPMLSWLTEYKTGRDFLTDDPLFDPQESRTSDRPREVMLGRLYMHLAPPIIFGSNATMDVPRALTQRDKAGLLAPLADAWRKRVESTPVLREMIVPRSEQPTLTAAVLGGYFALRARRFDLPKEQELRMADFDRQLRRIEYDRGRAARMLEHNQYSEDRFAEVMDRLDLEEQNLIERSSEERRTQYRLPSDTVYPRDLDYEWD